MPSRFLTLWSLFGRPSKSKKKDNVPAQVLFNPKHQTPIHLYGDGDDSSYFTAAGEADCRASKLFRRSTVLRKTTSVTKGHNKEAVDYDSRAQLSVGGTGPRSGRGCQAKRVAPPTVPDCGPSRHSGSSFASSASSSSTSASTASSSGGYGSVSSGWSSSDQRSSLGLDDSLPPPPSPGTVPPPFCNLMYREGEPIYGGRNLPSPGHAPIFTFPPSQNQVYGHLLSRSGSQPSSPHAKMDRDFSTTLLPHPSYLQQASVEDQGIDLTQSPGRESPSSSTGSSTGLKSSSSSSAGIGPGGTIILAGCRHSTTSTTSLDSGRASSYEHAHRHGSSSSSSVSTSTSSGLTLHQHRMSAGSHESCMRHSYHSSSSSLGSTAKSDDIHRLNVGDMLAQGVPEHEVLNAWLTDLGFEEYYDLFVQAGYDMHTITRMTPEDLTAIGIQKPNHRKKLKAELAQLNIPDGLPEFIPETLEEWLALLGLAEYSPSLRRQGYRTVEDVTQLTWEDLEDFGILRLGHQKKILLAIKRVKDILAGKWVPPPALDNCCYNAPDMAVPAGLAPDQQHLQGMQYRASHYAVPPPVSSLRLPPAFNNQQPIYFQYKQPLYQPDLVAIQVHRNKSSEDLRPFQGPAHNQNQGHVLAQGAQTFYKAEWRQRSYEEGDISPISETTTLSHPVAGGGTLPRPRGTVKPRPVAKISAKTRPDNEVASEVYKPAASNQVVSFQRNSSAGGVPQQQQQQQQQHYIYGTLTKRAPPLPPKRSVSSEEEAVYGQLAKASPLPPPPPPPADSLSLLSYSEDSEDFPPPPAPITASDSYLQHGQAAAAASVRERLDNILQRSGAGHWPRPHPGYGPYGPNPMNASRPIMPNSKTLPRDRECSPCDSIETSDTEAGSPNAEFRQRRNGSDASFKSTSSTESDSLPFANDNAGTIKQRSARPHPGLASLAYARSPAQVRRNVTNANHEISDVLNDIGNMLAGLTDELDAMLEEETKQKL